MQQVYIPRERVGLLKRDRSISREIEKACNCKIRVGGDDTVEIDGDAYAEYSAKSMLQAFGRGFEISIALRLAGDEYYFNSIDISQAASSGKRALQIKARIIGESGRTKKYIEQVSGAKISVYGDTVSFIGRIEEIGEAETAVNTLIDGGTHKLAYSRMEAAHRKNRDERKAAKF